MKKEVAECITKHFMSIIQANSQLSKDLTNLISESENVTIGKMVGNIYAAIYDLTKTAWSEYPELKPKDLK
jgi:flagellar motor switch protein FliG